MLFKKQIYLLRAILFLYKIKKSMSWYSESVLRDKDNCCITATTKACVYSTWENKIFHVHSEITRKHLHNMIVSFPPLYLHFWRCRLTLILLQPYHYFLTWVNLVYLFNDSVVYNFVIIRILKINVYTPRCTYRDNINKTHLTLYYMEYKEVFMQ